MPAEAAKTTTTTLLQPNARPPVTYGDVGVLGPDVTYGAMVGSRARRSNPLPQSYSTAVPAKKQSKWTPAEDEKIIELRGRKLKWEDVAKHLPGRSHISCRLHYQNYLERRSPWDEESKNKLARLYERFKEEMWSNISTELHIPWRTVEAMHWQLGEHEMARRAGVTPFTLQHQSFSDAPPLGAHRLSPPRGHAHSQSQGSALPSALHSPYGQPSVPYTSHYPLPGPGPSANGPPGHAVPSTLHYLPPGSGPGANGPPGQTRAARREHIPARHHQPTHYQQRLHLPGEQENLYAMPIPVPGPGLPPINRPSSQGGRRPGTLPSFAELTTGVSAYSTPAYAMPSGRSPSGTVSPRPGNPYAPQPSYNGYGPPSYYETHLEPTSGTPGKRRASPEEMVRETSRRRHLPDNEENLDVRRQLESDVTPPVNTKDVPL